MTYAAQETGTETGQPIELYEFNIGSESYLWTSDVVEVTYDSKTYMPVEIAREGIAFNPDERAEALKVTLPASTGIVRRYINSVPGQRATMTIRRVHRNDGADQVIQVFQGIVQTVGFSLNGMMAEIALLPITGELANSIPRFVFSSLCNHVLFDQGCTVSASLFRHQNTISGVAGDQITVTGLNVKGDGWAAGGYLALPSGEFRQILEHTGDVVRVLLPFPNSPLGELAEVFAGCAKDINTCSSKFNNVINHGGFAFVPLLNPFQVGLDNA